MQVLDLVWIIVLFTIITIFGTVYYYHKTIFLCHFGSFSFGSISPHALCFVLRIEVSETGRPGNATLIGHR